MDTKQIIAKHGGVSALARKLSEVSGVYFDRRRVSLWQRRGIPARVLLDFPKMFKGYERNEK